MRVRLTTLFALVLFMVIGCDKDPARPQPPAAPDTVEVCPDHDDD